MTASASARLFGGQFAGPGDRPRLSAQIERIRAWALARDFFTLREASEDLERLYAPTLFPESSLSAQLRNLARSSAGRLRCKKEKRRRGGGVWEYRLRATPEIRPAPAELRTDEPVEKISWPATLLRLEAVGYDFMGPAKECSCGIQFVWWITPAGKWMPLSMLENSRLIPHQAVCGNVKRFRQANARHQARAVPRPIQGALFL